MTRKAMGVKSQLQIVSACNNVDLTRTKIGDQYLDPAQLTLQLNAEAHPASLQCLTGLRGLAALYVMIYHLSVGVNHLNFLQPLIEHGYLAVDLFFILSGFILTHHYGEKTSTAEGQKLFLYNRVSRIYPLLTVMVIVSAAISSLNGYNYRISDVILGLTFFPFIIGTNCPLVVAWSVNTEIFAYLLFPWLVRVFLSARKRYVMLGMGAAIAILTVIANRSGVQIGQPIYRSGPLDVYSTASIFPILRCLAGFSLGIFSYAVYAMTKDITRLSKPEILFSVLILILGLLWASKLDVVIVLCFVPLIVCSAMQVAPCVLLLDAKPIVWLGEVSYSIYLIHGFLFQYYTAQIRSFLLDRHVSHPFAAAALLLALLVMVICPFTYYGMEKPARAWLRRRVMASASPVSLVH